MLFANSAAMHLAIAICWYTWHHQYMQTRILQCGWTDAVWEVEFSGVIKSSIQLNSQHKEESQYISNLREKRWITQSVDNC